MTIKLDPVSLPELPPFADPDADSPNRTARLQDLLGWLQEAPARFTDSEAVAALLAEGHDLFTACRNEVVAPPATETYDSLDDLLAADIEQAPEAIAGLQPGEVGVLFADAHLAADRLLLQLSVSLAAGEAAAPLLANNLAPRRVLYINSQWRLTYWRELLKTGLTHFADAAPARANLMLMSAKLGEPVVNLAEDGQVQHLLAFLKRQQADFVLIDDLMAFSDEAAEETSARHTRILMRRLQQVARQANCVILLTETVRRGDGGSGRRATLTGLADTVYRLAADKRDPSGVSILRAEKSRGALPPALLLRGEDDNSWFRITDEAPPETQSPPTLDELIAYVAEQAVAHTSDIVRHFAHRASPRKIAYLLKDAEMQERLVKDRHKGAWQVCDYQDPMQSTDEFAYQTAADLPQITLLDLNTIPNAPFLNPVEKVRLQKPVQKRKKHQRKNRRR